MTTLPLDKLNIVLICEVDERWSFVILLPFVAQTRQTLEEKLKGLPPEIIDKKFARLQDKDERKNAPANYHQQYQSEYPGDDVFFG